jgi:hypothetical protein
MRSESKPLVIGLIVVQAALSASLWVLNATSVNSTAAFALLLAADVLIFAGICHLAFFTEDEEDERSMSGAPVSVSAGAEEMRQVQPAQEEPLVSQPLIAVPTVLPRNIRLAVPLSSVALLLLLAVLVGSGHGTATDLFIPIYIFMVVVYVLSSIYLFKAVIERDKVTALPTGEQGGQTSHESHL